MNLGQTREVSVEARALTRWFHLNRRELPWRKEALSSIDENSVAEPGWVAQPSFRRDPYATWISEIMLQQTQVSTVIEYFSRWMKQFPTVFTLAIAREEEVMEAWAGLGYYSRARNILATARIVVDRYSGRFPWQRTDLLSLKGIGEYTAGAIASLAFNLPEPILDGNLVRVFSRRYGLAFLPKTSETKAVYWGWARAWVQSHEPALVNEGLMELGATLCTPKKPLCGACPLASSCVACAAGSQEQFPPTKIRKAILRICGIAVIAIRSGKTLKTGIVEEEVLVYRSPATGVLKGLWSFPYFTVTDITSLDFAWKKILPQIVVSNFSLQPNVVKHSITHHRLELKVATVKVEFGAKGVKKTDLPEGFKWVPIAELGSILVSSLPRKIWKNAH